MQQLNRRGLAFGLAATLGLGGGSAQAAVPHVVGPGETLWSVASANGFAPESVAAYNGLAAEALLIEGTTIQIPSAEEAGLAPATATAATAVAETSAAAPAPSEPLAPAPSEPPAPTPGSTYGLGHIPSPYGELHLDPAAASSWNAMREEALASYGIDLVPGGALSAFRTYEQQAYLYDLFLAGQGDPANPPGSSSHELGVAVDLAAPEMRSVIDQIGPAYGWYAPHSTEWWHVEYSG